MTRKNKGGRPTKKTEKLVNKLIEGFKADFTVEEACAYAGISKEAFYNWKEKDPKFVDEIEAAQRYIFTLAKKNILNAIKDNSTDDSWKLLQKRQAERYQEKITTENVNKNLNVELPVSTEEITNIMSKYDINKRITKRLKKNKVAITE